MTLVQQCSVLLPFIDGQELAQLYQSPWGGSWTSPHSACKASILLFYRNERFLATFIYFDSCYAAFPGSFPRDSSEPFLHSLHHLPVFSIQMLPVVISRSPEDPRVCLVNLRILL